MNEVPKKCAVCGVMYVGSPQSKYCLEDYLLKKSMRNMKNKSKPTLPLHKQIALGKKPAAKPVRQGLAKKK